MPSPAVSRVALEGLAGNDGMEKKMETTTMGSLNPKSSTPKP